MRIEITTGGGRLPTDRLLIAGGGALVAISPFVSWVHVAVLGNFNLLALLSTSKNTSAIGYLACLVGVTIAVLALVPVASRTVRVIAIIAAAMLGLVGGDFV